MADSFNPHWFTTDVYDFRKNFGEFSEDYMNLKHAILTVLLSRGARQIMLNYVRNTYTSFHSAFAGDNQVFVTYRHGHSLKVGYICDIPNDERNRKIQAVFINDA